MDVAGRLWDVSEELTGVRFGLAATPTAAGSARVEAALRP